MKGQEGGGGDTEKRPATLTDDLYYFKKVHRGEFSLQLLT